MATLQYIAIALFVALAGFFSGSETGFYCFSRIRLRFRLRRRWRGAAALHRLTTHPRLTITALLIGTNVSVYMATVLCAERLRELGLDHHTDLYSSLIMPPLLLIFSEIIPKSLFQRRADTLMYVSAWAIEALNWMLGPFLLISRQLGLLRQSIGLKWRLERDETITLERFRFFLSRGAAWGVLSGYQQAMANNILRIRSLRVESAMVPLERVVMVPEDATAGQFKELLREHRFSRMPVYSGSRTNIVGKLHVLDMFAAQDKEAPLAGLKREMTSLDSKLSVAEALYTLRKTAQQMAVVKGPQGDAIGLVTIKDLVEEIVGELAAW
jgi:putative hemolysin